MKPSTDVAVVFGGAIGDLIVFLEALDHLAQFQFSGGKRLFFVCKPVVAGFLKTVRPHMTIEIVDLRLKDYVINGKYRHQIAHRLSWRSLTLISPHQSKYAEAVCLLSHAPRRIELREKTNVNTISWVFWLNKFAYNERILVPADSMAFERFRALLVSLGCDSYETSLTLWEENSRAGSNALLIAGGDPYCVLAPTASEVAKSWEFEKYASVVQWILKNTSLNICICGGDEALGYCDRFGSEAGLPEIDAKRLIDCASKTDFAQWIELVRNASFCFGNDSATVHIAAHVKTPSICVTAGFCYGYCQPYVLDVVHKDDEIPHCLYAYKQCFRCFLRDYRRCSGNPDCKAAVDAGKPYLCIQDITLDQAIDALSALIGRLHLEGPAA